MSHSMEYLTEVRVGVQPLERFAQVLGEGDVRGALRVGVAMRKRLEGRVVWNVNSTAVGGGVAEMLPPLLGYTRSLGIDTRWVVIRGDADFFRVTKRLHHALHGSIGDGSALGDAEHEIYEATLRPCGLDLEGLARAGDFVVLHDPQTAGLAPRLRAAGCRVIWRCHIGADEPGPEVERGWAFLTRYLAGIPAFVFSRQAYVPEVCDHGKSHIITPSIDVFSAKNQEMSEECVRTILVHTGFVEGPPPAEPDHTFVRDDGSPSRVARRATVVRMGRPASWETPLVVQVSRWDPLKDPIGVMKGFVRLIDGECPARAELVLAGPDVTRVSDDPEGPAMFQGVVDAWGALPEGARNRIHLASIPTDDVEENAAIVNALQRHASVVVQKSLREGFGLTVTEAMWKGRPVIGSAIGGIQDQIVDGVSGVLLKDPLDLESFASQLRELLGDAALRAKIGGAARERVREEFLGMSHLIKYARLFEQLDAGG
jgi:trehalose synthase